MAPVASVADSQAVAQQAAADSSFWSVWVPVILGVIGAIVAFFRWLFGMHADHVTTRNTVHKLTDDVSNLDAKVDSIQHNLAAQRGRDEIRDRERRRMDRKLDALLASTCTPHPDDYETPMEDDPE